MKGKRKKSVAILDDESLMHKQGLEYKHCYYSVLTQSVNGAENGAKKAESKVVFVVVLTHLGWQWADVLCLAFVW